MADLVVGDITTTIERRSIEGKTRRNRVKLVFGDGSKTYPSGGIPMPVFGTLGMKRNVDFLTIFDENDASGIIWKYDAANHKLRGYVMSNHAHKFQIANGAPHGSGNVAVSAITGSADATLRVAMGSGVTLNTGSPVGSGGDRTLLAELEATVYAPAAQTLYAEAVGW
jgi:hypothetical protein